MPITITNLVCELFDDTIPHLVEGDFVFVPYVDFLPIDEDDYKKIVYDLICPSRKNEIWAKNKFNTWKVGMKLNQSI
jgi:hypothetical protein